MEDTAYLEQAIRSSSFRDFVSHRIGAGTSIPCRNPSGQLRADIVSVCNDLAIGGTHPHRKFSIEFTQRVNTAHDLLTVVKFLDMCLPNLDEFLNEFLHVIEPAIVSCCL